MSLPTTSLFFHFCARLGAKLRRGGARFRGEFHQVLPRFSADSRANVAMTFALISIPIIFAAGMGVDYTMAARRQTKLDAAADAAALAAVTPAMISANTCSVTVQCAANSQSLATTGQSAACNAAENMFCAQASTVPGVSSINLTVNVTQPPAINTPTQQQAAISYTALSQTAFAGVIRQNTINIAGKSTASAATAPNINFYVLADDSPSMAIPATTAGINAMMTATAGSPQSGTNEGGCAFACHESNPAYDNLGNPGGEDNYALARNLGLTLRLDNLTTAIENLASTASSTEASNKAIYNMAIYTFDTNASAARFGSGCTYGTPLNTIANLTSNMNTASNEASGISLLEVYNNSGLLTSTCNDSDADTDIDDSLTGINSIMPTPGNGTNSRGDSPQEVLFFVTDGVEDYMNGGNRQISLLDTGNCTAIKNRVSSKGLPIRIAVLYLDYLPLPSNSFYTSNVAPFQPNIGTTLQSCASSGLYAEVTTDQDISAALTALFINAVNTAHLTQ
jgi:Flp pilus assembly protein TadG